MGPPALKLVHWASLVRIAAQTAAEVVEVKSASGWLKASEGDRRNQRLAPLAARAGRSGHCCGRRATSTWVRSGSKETRPGGGSS